MCIYAYIYIYIYKYRERAIKRKREREREREIYSRGKHPFADEQHSRFVFVRKPPPSGDGADTGAWVCVVACVVTDGGWSTAIKPSHPEPSRRRRRSHQSR